MVALLNGYNIYLYFIMALNTIAPSGSNDLTNSLVPRPGYILTNRWQNEISTVYLERDSLHK